MGTRSLTYVYDGLGPPVACLFRQYDGAPDAHGRELAEFLNGYEIVNGLGLARPKIANGMGCLAAQMIAHFKTETGNFYLHGLALDRDDGQDYEYHVYEDKIKVIRCIDQEILYLGDWVGYMAFCNLNV